jgi:hypothetical protein
MFELIGGLWDVLTVLVMFVVKLAGPLAVIVGPLLLIGAIAGSGRDR